MKLSEVTYVKAYYSIVGEGKRSPLFPLRYSGWSNNQFVHNYVCTDEGSIRIWDPRTNQTIVAYISS